MARSCSSVMKTTTLRLTANNKHQWKLKRKKKRISIVIRLK